MRRLWFLLPLLLSAAHADQITFTFIGQSTSAITANSSAFALGSSGLVSVTDTTTNTTFPLTAQVTADSDTPTSFTVTTMPNVVTATYEGGRPDSVFICCYMGDVILSGTLTDGGRLLSTYPEGTGAFLSSFHVAFVDPVVLGLFHLDSFGSQGAFSATFGSADLVPGPQLDAIVGGGDVTIQAAVAVPDPPTLTLAGCGLMFCATMMHRRKR